MEPSKARRGSDRATLRTRREHEEAESEITEEYGVYLASQVVQDYRDNIHDAMSQPVLYRDNSRDGPDILARLWDAHITGVGSDGQAASGLSQASQPLPVNTANLIKLSSSINYNWL